MMAPVVALSFVTPLALVTQMLYPSKQQPVGWFIPDHAVE